MSDSNEQVHKKEEHAVRSFFQDPRVAEAVVDHVVRKKPVTWSRRSNAPYYKERHALAIKAVIDDMLSTRQDQIYFYHDFPGISRDTLYLRINQSIRYLLDRLDTPDHLYARWNEMVSITRERGIGVRISFNDDYRFGEVADFKPKAVISKKEVPRWKDQIDDYLSSTTIEPLIIPRLTLTQDEIAITKESLKAVTGILFKVNSYEIKILKTK